MVEGRGGSGFLDEALIELAMFSFPIIGTDLDRFTGIESFQGKRYQFFFRSFVGPGETFYVSFNSDTFCLRLRAQSGFKFGGNLDAHTLSTPELFLHTNSIPDRSLLSRRGEPSLHDHHNLMAIRWEAEFVGRAFAGEIIGAVAPRI